jgi:hypothetical protein
MVKLSELTEQDLLVIQKTGIDADNFLRGNDLFVRHIKPALEVKREAAKRDGDWNPGKTTDATAALAYNAFNSGVRAGLLGIDAVCMGIINRGIDAAKELDRRRKINAKKEGN